MGAAAADDRNEEPIPLLQLGVASPPLGDDELLEAVNSSAKIRTGFFPISSMLHYDFSFILEN